MVRCPRCYDEFGETAVVDGANTICSQCGEVLEEAAIITDAPMFAKDAAGNATATGQFISTTVEYDMLSESRQQTLDRGTRDMTRLAEQLGIPAPVCEMGKRFLHLATHKNFMRGRSRRIVVPTCLYLASRRDKTPHLLVDFADAGQVDVYALARTYEALCEALCLGGRGGEGPLPDIVDPALFAPRFASRLEFGDKKRTMAIVNTALRIIQRMRRDWLHAGRRPSGIVGAALVISARLHGFDRTPQDIAEVVSMSDSTIKRRILEFSQTPASALTVVQFQALADGADGAPEAEEFDPPAFTRARKAEQKLQRQQELLRKIREGEEDAEQVVSRLREEKEEEDSQRRAEHKKMLREAASLVVFPGSGSGKASEGSGSPASPATALTKHKGRKHVLDDDFDEDEEPDEEEEEAPRRSTRGKRKANDDSDSVKSKKRKRGLRRKMMSEIKEQVAADAQADELAHEITQALENPELTALEKSARQVLTENQSAFDLPPGYQMPNPLQINPAEGMQQPEQDQEEGQPVEEPLDDVKDSEIEHYLIVSDDEYKQRKEIWEGLNEEEYQKREERRKQRLEKHGSREPRQRKKRAADDYATETPKKTRSAQINYDVLLDLSDIRDASDLLPPKKSESPREPVRAQPAAGAGSDEEEEEEDEDEAPEAPRAPEDEEADLELANARKKLGLGSFDEDEDDDMFFDDA
eukprot:m51a1_g1614 hypothetical protein (698) ;mRNA; r:210713-213170